MKYLKILQQVVSLATITALLNSCEKIVAPEPLGDSGQTIVKIIDGGQAPASPGFKLFNVDFVNTPQPLTLVDIRRDVPNGGELNKTMTIVVKDDTTALNAYNDELINSGSDPLVYLPENFYTINASTPKVGGKGGNFTVTFNAGEFAKEIKVVLPDATLFDPSTKYGLAFTITSADQNGKVSLNKTIIVAIGAKNILHEDYKWDFLRWNAETNDGPPSTSFVGELTTFVTVASDINEVHSGYFIQPRYRIKFSNNGGVLSNFSVTFNPSDVADLLSEGVTVVDGPNILIADHENRHFKFQYKVFNGSAFRYLIDDYYQ